MEAVAVRSKENVENDQDEVFGILNSLKVVDLIYIYIYIYILGPRGTRAILLDYVFVSKSLLNLC